MPYNIFSILILNSFLGLDINRLTPIEALTKLNDLRGIITAK